jgi:intein-encoded DNA endonuclease-like protein
MAESVFWLKVRGGVVLIDSILYLYSDALLFLRRRRIGGVQKQQIIFCIAVARYGPIGKSWANDEQFQ